MAATASAAALAEWETDMGLLGDSWDDPKTQAALNLAAGLLSGGNFGQALGKGLAGYQQSMSAAQEADVRKLMFEQERQKAQDAKDLRMLANQFYKPGATTEQVFSMPGAAGPTLERAAVQAQQKPTFDSDGFLTALYGKNPLMAMDFQAKLAKETPFGKVDPKDFTPESVAKFAITRQYGDLVPRTKMEVASSGQVYDPYAIKAGTVLVNPNQPFAIGPDGKPVANSAFQRYEISKAGAGAPKVNVSTEKTLLGTIAEGIGKQVTGSLDQARGAAGTLNTISNLNAALNSGKVLAGPGTKPEMLLQQIGTQLGVGGKDGVEKLTNTRAALQSLAQLELDGAAALRGQGQITEGERELVRRASSGDLSMTLPELKTLSSTLEKSSRYRIAQHNQSVQPLLNNKNTASFAPMLTVQPPANFTPLGIPAASPQPGIIDFGALK